MSDETNFGHALGSALASIQESILLAHAQQVATLEEELAKLRRIGNGKSHNASLTSDTDSMMPETIMFDQTPSTESKRRSFMQAKRKFHPNADPDSNSELVGSHSSIGGSKHVILQKSVSSMSLSKFPVGSHAKFEGIVESLKTRRRKSANSTPDCAEAMHDYCRSDALGNGLIGFIIVLDTLAIGLSIDYPEFPWIIVESIFTLIFIIELLCNLKFQGCSKFFCGVDRFSNIFEFMLVVFAVFELVMWIASQIFSNFQGTTTTLSIFGANRLARIGRVARLARLRRFQTFKDLFTMCNAAAGGFKTLLWSFLLIMLPLYVLALLLTEMLGQYAEEEAGAETFRNLSTSLFTVFRCIVAGDCTNKEGRPIFWLITENYGWQYMVIYILSIWAMLFGFFNVITAVFVDNIMASAKFSDIQKKYRRLMDTERFNAKTSELIDLIWKTHMAEVDSDQVDLDAKNSMDFRITPSFFDKLLNTREFNEILKSLDIAYEDQLDLFETLDVDGGGTIDIEELILGIAKLRGDARRTDIVGISLVVRAMQAELSMILDHLQISKIRRSQERDSEISKHRKSQESISTEVGEQFIEISNRSRSQESDAVEVGERFTEYDI